MPRTIRFAIEQPQQGYPVPSGDQNVLAHDLQILKISDHDDLVREQKDAIKLAARGKACSKLRGLIGDRVVTLVSSEGAIGEAIQKHRPDVVIKGENEKINKDHKPDDIQVGALRVKMGPLKLVPRIMEKAV